MGILGGDGRRDDNVVTREPVDRADDTVLVGGLEGVDATEDLRGVAASGGGVGHDKANLLGGVDDEDGADGKSHACEVMVRMKFALTSYHPRTLSVNVSGVLVVDHVELVGNLALGVGDDGEGELGASDLVNILDPGLVGVGAIGALESQQCQQYSTTK